MIIMERGWNHNQKKATRVAGNISAVAGPGIFPSETQLLLLRNSSNIWPFRDWFQVHLYSKPEVSQVVSMRLSKGRIVKWMAIGLLNTLVIILVSYGDWNYVQIYYFSWQQLEKQTIGERSSAKIKTVLFWNGPRRSEMTIFGTGHDAFVQHGCPVSNCEIINSPHQYPDRPLDFFDAILFNFNDEFWLTERPNFERRPHQRFVFFTLEPPPSIELMNITGYTNYFNWTMTYRRDSDILLLYGRIRPKSSAPTTSEKIQA